MKKTTQKLILRRETVRALRALDHHNLARVVGGEATLYESGKVNCPAPGLVATTAGG